MTESNCQSIDVYSCLINKERVIVLYCIVLHYIVLQSITLHCIVSYCIVLNCIVFTASNCVVLLYCIVLGLLPIRGNNLCKPRQQNRILVPLRGSFQNLRRSLLSILYGSPPGGGAETPRIWAKFLIKNYQEIRKTHGFLPMALVSDLVAFWATFLAG